MMSRAVIALKHARAIKGIDTKPNSHTQAAVHGADALHVVAANWGSRMNEGPLSPRDLTEWPSSDARTVVPI